MPEYNIFERYTESDVVRDTQAAADALSQGDADKALFYALCAYRRRKLRPCIWRLLAISYHKLGKEAEAVKFAALYDSRGGEEAKTNPLNLQMNHWQHMDMIYLSLLEMYGAPTYTKFGLNQKWAVAMLYGKFLIGAEPAGSKFWCGVYNPYGRRDSMAELMNYLAQAEADGNTYSGFYTDFAKARLTKEVRLNFVDDTEAVIGVAGTVPRQEISLTRREKITAAGGHDEITQQNCQSQYEFEFYRVKDAVKISSSQEFAVTAPVILKHSPRRLKSVLHIMIDALSWAQMKKENYRYVPNIRHFFDEGIIFDCNYAPAEHTYASVPALETGMHTHRTQLLNLKVYAELDPEYITMAEQMKKLGYYCVGVSHMPDGTYNRVDRGFDRLISGQYISPAGEAVERTIEHLSAFDECDNFLRCHIFDVHLNHAKFPISAKTQVKLPWYESISTNYVASVNQPKTARNVYENYAAIERVDRQLGILFDYITSKYREDEYLICLYSDHGVSFFSDEIYYLSEEQNGAALMVRGADVPAIGRVGELTSGLDLYPIMEKLLGFKAPPGQLDGNLPACLGGTERKYVISQSIYPGQTYKLCLRTQQYECRLESAKHTRSDGTVDLSDCTLDIYTRDADHLPVYDVELAQTFIDIITEHTASFNVAD